jgi:hypothetical protein
MCEAGQSRQSAVCAGRKQHVEFALQDPVERGEALRDQVRVRREIVVRQRFPVREHANAQLRREPRNFFGQAMRIVRACADDGDL